MSGKDLTRFRKTYFTKRQKPIYGSLASGESDIEASTIPFVNTNTGTYTTTKSYISPVVVITPSDNINAWIASLVNNGNNWVITLQTSSNFTGNLHIQIGEAI